MATEGDYPDLDAWYPGGPLLPTPWGSHHPARGRGAALQGCPWRSPGFQPSPL